jgi:hypothetical protein
MFVRGLVAVQCTRSNSVPWSSENTRKRRLLNFLNSHISREKKNKHATSVEYNRLKWFAVFWAKQNQVLAPVAFRGETPGKLPAIL